MFVRQFEYGTYLYDPEEPWADILPPVAVYQFISENEAKLTDTADADYVGLLLEHSAHSRSHTAKLVIDGALWVLEDKAVCAIDSNVVAFAVFRAGTRAVVNRNLPPYRGKEQEWAAEVWEMSVPPRLVTVLYSREPVTLESISASEVI